MNNLFDKEFFNMTTAFAVIVIGVLGFISYLGTQMSNHQTAAPAAVEASASPEGETF